ncbi:MAG: glycosyltransferase family 87 protein [Pseudolabrys sp.]|nr:glycosyltransferase family 87 protein [Pseudolabrys sp.]
MRKWLDRYGPWIALVVASVAYYRRYLSPQDAGMLLYPQAAQCLIDNKIMQVCAGAFTYPPGFAFVMTPFAAMPMGLRLIVWYVITIGVTVGAYKLSERLAARLFVEPFGLVEQGWARILALVLSIKFALAVLENQAYDTLSLVFVMLGLMGLAHRRDALGGAAIGLAAAIKATPLIFLPYLIVKRRFVAAAAFTAAYLLLSFAPDIVFTPVGASEGYFAAWLHHIAGASLLNPEAAQFNFWSGANSLNHSLRGAVSLQINEVTQGGLFKAVWYGVDLAFIALCAALIMLRKERPGLLAIDASILLIATLMLSPMTSRSHYVVLIVPYVTLSMVLLRDQATKWIGIAVLGLSFILLTATSNDVVGKAMSDWAYFHSFLVLGALAMLIYIAVIVWNPATLRDARPYVAPWPKEPT